MVEIRQATVTDVETIHHLLKNLAKDLGKEAEYKGSAANFKEYSSNFYALIAWNDDLPVGLVVYFLEFSTWRGAPGVYVQDLYVHKSVRGQSVGKKLTGSVIERAGKQGATYMRLSVHNSNVAGAAFYEAVGFGVADNEKIYVIEGSAFKALGE